MPLLKATYNIKLPSRLRIKYPDGDQLCFKVTIGEFQTEVTLIIEKYPVLDFNVLYSRNTREMKIVVSKDLDSEPPRPKITEQGNLDYFMVTPWFNQNTKGFNEAAVKTTNRVVKFFRYNMFCPYLYEYSGHEEEFQNPEWTNSNNEIVNSGIINLSLNIDRAKLGEIDFTINQAGDLQAVLENDLNIGIYQEFLADAQASILNSKLARGILELAVACEVAVKQTYAKRGIVSDPVRKYLEGESRREFVSLLHKDAEYTFGESFKTISVSDYNHIDYLFRTRNKIAHRGELSYKDDGNVSYRVGHQMIDEWYKSVLILLEWLRKFN